MSKKITIGKSSAGDVRLDVERLIVSRLLITASSGGGKSYLLRKILEGVSLTTQTIVIDTEGEFASLREKRDMVLAGPNGETSADPRSAGLLCRRLMELNLSAVVDVSELARSDKRSFVANFVNTLVDLPRSLWRACFIVVDETHEYAAEGEKSESGAALSLLASKGRKRGYCLMGATQRLQKLDKDVAAELKNVFIGQMSLDVDLKRAADLLGFGKDRWSDVRDREPGEFWGFGPAMNAKGVTMFRGDPVETTHPKAGQGRLAEPPAPSEKIRGVLDELKDLPQQAEAEIKDLVAARRKIAELERAVRIAGKPTDTRPAADEHNKHQAATISRLRKGLAEAMKVIAQIEAKGFEATTVDPEQIRKALDAAAGQIVKLVEQKMTQKQAEFDRLRKEARRVLDQLTKLLEADVDVRVGVQHNEPFTVNTTSRPVAASRPSALPRTGPTPKGEQKILIAIAQHTDGVTREQLTVLTGYKRSSRDTYLQRLRSSGMIEEADQGIITATAAGVHSLGEFEPLPTGDALREHWLAELPDGSARLPIGERKILGVLVERYPEAIERSDLDDATGFKRSSRDTYLQRLTARTLVVTVGKKVKASDMLFG